MITKVTRRRDCRDLVIVFGWIMLVWLTVVAAISCARVTPPRSHQPAGHGWNRGGCHRRGCAYVRPRLSAERDHLPMCVRQSSATSAL
jgi:hypothetical protein